MEGLVVLSGAFGANKMYIRHKLPDISAALPAKGVGPPISMSMACAKTVVVPSPKNGAPNIKVACNCE
jgi:hypothetical protein